MSDSINASNGPVQTAFAASVSGNPAVFTAQGSAAQQTITVDPTELGITDQGAAVSALLAPDGTHLAYCVSTGTLEKSVLKLANLSDGSTIVLAEAKDQEHFSGFAWKPDGSQLAYMTQQATPTDNDPDLTEIWTVVLGGQPTKLYGDDVLQLLGWSSDGSKIYFTRRQHDSFNYSVLDSATGHVTNVLLPDEADGTPLSIVGLTYGFGKGDGLLAYSLSASSYLQNSKDSPILIVNVDNGKIVKQFKSAGAAVNLVFSPDQSMLAYTDIDFGLSETDKDDGSSIQIYNLSDGTTKPVLPNKVGIVDYRVLAWAGDNSGVFITCSDKSVQFVDLAGNQTTVVEGEAPEEGLSVGGDLRVSAFGIRGAVVNLDAPYIHQVKEVPEGFDGNWACNACSATMVAAYYGKLVARNDTFRGNKSAYGWYISNEFTSPADGFVFNRVQNDASGRSSKGAYAQCTEGGDGYAWRIVEYLKHLGLKAVFRGSVTMSMIKDYLNAAKPIVLSTQIHGFGHIVCLKGYLPDGRLITNDPYWGRPGAGECVYTWGDLGTAWWMVTVDDEAPAAGTPPATVETPTPQPVAPPPVAAPSTPVVAPPIEVAAPQVIEVGTGNEAVAARFRTTYDRCGGEGGLGRPTSKVYNYNQRWIQEFKGGSRNDSLIMLDERFDRAGDTPVPTVQPAFTVGGAFLRVWRENYGGSAGALGSPVSDEFVNLQGDRQQNFEGGYVTLQGTGDDLQGAFPWPDGFNAWKAEYFNNTGLTGKPSFVRDESPNASGGISYDWANSGPEGGKLGVLADNFSARYTRAINFGDGGIFNFSVSADDGFRFTIDGQNLAGPNPNQFWLTGGTGPQSFRVQIGAGVHTLVLEYLQIGGGASFALDLSQG